jgi:3-hydroxyisobutyrate dehydrogenase-like beta-hydroxyacid dehydrogenase
MKPHTFFQDCRMFENRVPHMLDGDYTPYSALDIFVKDLVRLKSTYAFFFLVETTHLTNSP